MTNLTAYITVSGYEEGKLKHHTFKANSLVTACIQILRIQFENLATPIVDTSGTGTARGTYGTAFAANAGAAANLFGVMVGSGTNAVSLTDNKLQTLITHGTGATQVSYGAVSFTNPATVDTTRSFTVARAFTGNASAAVTVNEIGLYVKEGGNYYFCIDRTLNTFIIPKSTAKTVTYTIGITL
jgi:hypothetical protein